MTNDIDLKGRATFARNLRAFRRRRGLSQNDVARATGIALTHVSDIELRKVNFTVDTAVKLAAVLQMPLWRLLKPDAEAEPVSGGCLRNSRRGSARAPREEGASRIG